MNKYIRIIFISMIILLSFTFIGNNSYARRAEGIDGAGGTGGTGEIDGAVGTVSTVVDPIENPDFFDPSSAQMGEHSKFIEKANTILAIIRILGTVISVVSLMAIGIKYMFGSTAEKASYKETMVPYIIGAVMVFAIPNFLGVIFDLVKSINF